MRHDSPTPVAMILHLNEVNHIYGLLQSFPSRKQFHFCSPISFLSRKTNLLLGCYNPSHRGSHYNYRQVDYPVVRANQTTIPKSYVKCHYRGSPICHTKHRGFLGLAGATGSPLISKETCIRYKNLCF